MPPQVSCSDHTLISTVKECNNAADLLGIPYGYSGNWQLQYDFRGCFVARDGRNKIFFNTASDLITTAESMSPKYRAICEFKGNPDYYQR